MISKEEYDELYNKMKKYKKLAKEYKEKYEKLIAEKEEEQKHMKETYVSIQQTINTLKNRNPDELQEKFNKIYGADYAEKYSEEIKKQFGSS